MHHDIAIYAAVKLLVALLREGDNTVRLSVERKITTLANIASWEILVSLLADNNIAGSNGLPTEYLHAKAARIRISSVLCGTCCFLV